MRDNGMDTTAMIVVFMFLRNIKMIRIANAAPIKAFWNITCTESLIGSPSFNTEVKASESFFFSSSFIFSWIPSTTWTVFPAAFL